MSTLDDLRKRGEKKHLSILVHLNLGERGKNTKRSCYRLITIISYHVNCVTVDEFGDPNGFRSSSRLLRYYRGKCTFHKFNYGSNSLS